jgi:peptidoglycan/LPS O-acetylase OafA/YrhL
MGWYRLALAYAVLLSHVPFRPFGLDIGVLAVISFFLLSGYVMTALIDRHYAEARDIGWFYMDRLARLYPQYLFWLLVAALLVHGFQMPDAFVTIAPDATLLAAHALILPLNFFMYFPHDYLLLPQAWSLGLEMAFYAAIPWMLLHRMRLPLAVASASIFLLADAGVIQPYVFGYNLLPGTLFIFILGSWLRRCETRGERRAMVGFCIGIPVALGLAQFPALGLAEAHEMLLGLAIGLPVVAALARMRAPRGDGCAGNLSYGVFLNHFLLILLAEAWLGRPPEGWEALPLALLSTALAALSFACVEQPVLRLRRGLRGRVTPAGGHPA